MAQLIPLPLTVSCFSKIQIGFTFLVPAHRGSPGQRAVKRVCVCVCVFVTAAMTFCRGKLCGLNVRSQHMNSTELNGSKSTQLHDAFIGDARQRHDLIGCGKTRAGDARRVLDGQSPVSR